MANRVFELLAQLTEARKRVEGLREALAEEERAMAVLDRELGLELERRRLLRQREVALLEPATDLREWKLARLAEEMRRLCEDAEVQRG